MPREVGMVGHAPVEQIVMHDHHGAGRPAKYHFLFALGPVAVKIL